MKLRTSASGLTSQSARALAALARCRGPPTNRPEGVTKPSINGTYRASASRMSDPRGRQDLFKEATRSGVAPRRVNSVDATTGQPIVARVTARKQELEALLAALPADRLRARNDVVVALATINDLLTGDLEHVPAVVAADMSRWLEHNKHLAEPATEVRPLARGTRDLDPIVDSE